MEFVPCQRCFWAVGAVDGQLRSEFLPGQRHVIWVELFSARFAHGHWSERTWSLSCSILLK